MSIAASGLIAAAVVGLVYSSHGAKLAFYAATITFMAAVTGFALTS